MAEFATTPITGTIGTGDVLALKQVPAVDKSLHMIYDDNHLAPMVAITAKNAVSRGKVARNPYFSWIKKDLFPQRSAVAVGAAAGSTLTIQVDDFTFFKVGDTVEFPEMATGSTTTNVGYVSTATTTPTIIVTPVGFQSDGSTALTFLAATVGMEIHILADASDEYSVMPVRKTVKDTSDHNYIQFIRVPYEIGNIQLDQENYTGPERKERRDETLREIKMQWERVLLWGERGYVTGTTGRKFFSRGLWKYIKSAAGDNILDWSGGLTESQLDEYLIDGPCKTGSQRKYWFLSADLFLKIVELAKAKERIISTRINQMGLAIKEYQAINGRILYLHQHYMFTGAYEGAGMIVDPNFVQIRPYSTQGVIRLHTNIQAPDAAGIADEWRIIAGPQVSRTEPLGIQYQ